MSLPSSADNSAQKPSTNVYTVMLIIAFGALVIACGLLLIELVQFGPGVPWAVPVPGGS